MASQDHQRGFTLVELMIGLVVLGVLAAVALPAFQDFRLVQRLKSIHAQVVTDMQFARSEAVTRNTILRITFRNNDTTTCYTLYTTDDPRNPCDCRRGAGLACQASASAPPIGTEVRTVVVPRSLSVTLSIISPAVPGFGFDPVTGGIVTIPKDTDPEPMDNFAILSSIADSSRTLRTTVGRSGRPTVCATSPNLGAEICPPPPPPASPSP
ncbi:MAG: GspH/FimT family pseudopilin [Burkholderiaceae bacterium]|nr:GspH/FimT family pseudopilin [Burkholderiaceae bacterium]